MTSNIYSHIISILDESQLFYSKEPFKGEDDLYHLLYLITNSINDRFYIGVHTSKKPIDQYRGSGKILAKAYEKYGKCSFVFQRVAYFQSRSELSKAEERVVTLQLLEQYKDVIYNVKTGGLLNHLDPIHSAFMKQRWQDPELRPKLELQFQLAQKKRLEISRSEEGRKRSSEWMTSLWQNENWKQQRIQQSKKRFEDNREAVVLKLKQNSDKARLVNLKPIGGSYEKNGPIVICFEGSSTASKTLEVSHTSIQSAIREQYRCCLLYWRFLSKEEVNEYKHIYNPDQNNTLVKDLVESYQQQKGIIHSREARTARIKAQAKPPVPIGGSYEPNGDIIVCFEGSRVCAETIGIGRCSCTTSITKKCKILGVYWRYITPEEVDKHRDVYNLPQEHELIQSIIKSRKPRKSKKHKE